ncbi:MAG: SAM hydrolase/SAM-dependent halogenase family protein [Bacteroidota bacterium]
MSLVTLTSDFGYQDHYAAIVKGRILQSCPHATIVDVSHGIEPFNVMQGAHVLKAAYASFPSTAVHIFAVQGGYEVTRHIAFKWNQHYFVGSDNGFAGLLGIENIEQCVEIKTTLTSSTAFLAQTLYAPVAAQLAQGVPLQEIGHPIPAPKKFIASVPRITEKKIVGHVIHVDHYGNLVTNIAQEIFMQQCLNRKFEIRFARESIYSLHTHYTQVEPGDCVCIFNSLSLLEIAINQGSAANLLGLQYDSPVCISFQA